MPCWICDQVDAEHDHDVRDAASAIQQLGHFEILYPLWPLALLEQDLVFISSCLLKTASSMMVLYASTLSLSRSHAVNDSEWRSRQTAYCNLVAW